MNEDKELEESIRIYNELKKHKEIIGSIDTDFFFKFAETVLQALDEEKYFNKIHSYHMKYNFIPKKKIEDELEEIENKNYTRIEYNYRKRIYKELLEEK